MRGFEGIDGCRPHDALDLLGRGVIEAFQLRAEDRGPLDGGVQHSRHLRVDAELASAAGMVALLHGRHLFADVAELTFGLQCPLAFFRHWKSGSYFDEFAVAGFLATFGVDDKMVLAFTFRDWHVPLLGGGLFEHEPDGGAGGAHSIVEIADGARAVGILRAVFHVAQRLLDAHLLPIGFELIGDDHRQDRSNSGPHLGPVGDDDGGAVRLDAEVDAWHPSRSGAFDLVDLHAEHERTRAECGA